MLAFGQRSPFSLEAPAVNHGDTRQPLELLQTSYEAYLAASKDPNPEANKKRLTELAPHLAARGLHGNFAVRALESYQQQISWQSMSPEAFSSFYRYVFFICREPNKRNVQTETAVHAWSMILQGRFRLLERWCSFVVMKQQDPKVPLSVISEDTWRQVLDFSRAVHEDLGNYDPAAAWPVLLDDFVEYLRAQRTGSRSAPMEAEPLNVLNPWGNRQMVAISPRSGSKRKQLDMQEVMDQLQQIPLLSEEAPEPSRAAFAPKRARLVASSKPPTGSPSKSSSASHARPDAVTLPAAALGGSCSSPSSSMGPHGALQGGGRKPGPPWVGPGLLCGYSSGGESDVDARTDSINAMMQVTVVETLGLH